MADSGFPVVLLLRSVTATYKLAARLRTRCFRSKPATIQHSSMPTLCGTSATVTSTLVERCSGAS
jgi:hypothetical protein